MTWLRLGRATLFGALAVGATALAGGIYGAARWAHLTGDLVERLEAARVPYRAGRVDLRRLGRRGHVDVRLELAVRLQRVGDRAVLLGASQDLQRDGRADRVGDGQIYT